MILFYIILSYVITVIMSILVSMKVNRVAFVKYDKVDFGWNFIPIINIGLVMGGLFFILAKWIDNIPPSKSKPNMKWYYGDRWYLD